MELEPEESLRLSNVLSHAIGGVWMEVRNPSDSLPAGHGTIIPELRDLPAASPMTGAPAPTGGGL